MSRPLIGSDQGGQLALLPVDVREVLPPDHRVWQVLAQVEEFDLGPFLGAYRADGVGRPPYHPRVIIALIVYCYGKRQRTLREITTACRDDLGARVIVEGRVPSISTLSEFMKTHRDPLRALLAQTVAMGEVEGLVDLSLVAGDGTKMNANAAMTATTDESGLRAQITDLEHQIQATAAVWADRVAAHPAGADPGTPGPGLFDLDADPADPGPDASADPGPDDPAGPVADPVGGLTEEK
jgi:transposase